MPCTWRGKANPDNWLRDLRAENAEPPGEAARSGLSQGNEQGDDGEECECAHTVTSVGGQIAQK